MTDVVTYADLNFNSIPMTENIYTGDDRSDHGDIMYENVENLTPPTFRDPPDPSGDPSNEGKDPPLSNRCIERLSSLAGCRSSLLCFLLFALLLSAAIIGLAVKYASKSQETQRLSERLQEMNDSYVQRLRSDEDLLTSTKAELERTKKMLEELAEGMSTLKASLHQCDHDKDKAINDHRSAETSLSRAELRVTGIENDLCPENWIMIGKKCLFFSKEARGWYDSEQLCLRMSGNLLTLRDDDDDEALKSYLSNKGDYWLGKELRWKKNWNWKPEWTWPDVYRKYGRGNTLWKIRNGNITVAENREYNACICERDILLGKYFSVVADKMPGFALHNKEYSCKPRD